MECKKCLVNIPNEFEFILSQNVCPKCGNKLMADVAMKIYMDLKKRLHEVEFIMDKTVVCERIAMFVVTNYEIIPLGGTKIQNTQPTINSHNAVEAFKAQLASIDTDIELDTTAEDIRAEEAMRAEELIAAREMGMDVDNLEEDDDEEIVSGRIDVDRVQRLKKLAISSKSGGIVRRIDS